MRRPKTTYSDRPIRDEIFKRRETIKQILTRNPRLQTNIPLVFIPWILRYIDNYGNLASLVKFLNKRNVK